jgi:hypothetical protein
MNSNSSFSGLLDSEDRRSESFEWQAMNTATCSDRVFLNNSGPFG